jgi:hypothetical protein
LENSSGDDRNQPWSGVICVKTTPYLMYLLLSADKETNGRFIVKENQNEIIF